MPPPRGRAATQPECTSNITSTPARCAARPENSGGCMSVRDRKGSWSRRAPCDGAEAWGPKAHGRSKARLRGWPRGARPDCLSTSTLGNLLKAANSGPNRTQHYSGMRPSCGVRYAAAFKESELHRNSNYSKRVILRAATTCILQSHKFHSAIAGRPAAEDAAIGAARSGTWSLRATLRGNASEPIADAHNRMRQQRISVHNCKAEELTRGTSSPSSVMRCKGTEVTEIRPRRACGHMHTHAPFADIGGAALNCQEKLRNT